MAQNLRKPRIYLSFITSGSGGAGKTSILMQILSILLRSPTVFNRHTIIIVIDADGDLHKWLGCFFDSNGPRNFHYVRSRKNGFIWSDVFKTVTKILEGQTVGPNTNVLVFVDTGDRLLQALQRTQVTRVPPSYEWIVLPWFFVTIIFLDNVSEIKKTKERLIDLEGTLASLGVVTLPIFVFNPILPLEGPRRTATSRRTPSARGHIGQIFEDFVRNLTGLERTVFRIALLEKYYGLPCKEFISSEAFFERLNGLQLLGQTTTENFEEIGELLLANFLAPPACAPMATQCRFSNIFCIPVYDTYFTKLKTVPSIFDQLCEMAIPNAPLQVFESFFPLIHESVQSNIEALFASPRFDWIR